VRRQREAVEAIANAGGGVTYDYEPARDSNELPLDAEPPGPDWLRQLFGDDYFTSVVGVDLVGTQLADSDLGPLTQKHLRWLPRLARLDLDATYVTDAGLEHVRRLSHLRALGLCGTEVTEAGVKKLQQALPNCMITR
jgi:hypothetical protein